MADKSSIIKQAQKFLAKGQIDKAVAEWEKLIKEAPDGNSYNTLGDLYLKKGDRNNAVDSYQKAANFFRHEGFSLKAVALYKKVLNINPAEPDSLYALGELSEEKGLTNEAVRYYLAMADSLSKAGKKDRLLDIYEKILSLSPTNISLREKVADIFLKEGLKTDASKEYVFIARIYDEKRDYKRSMEYYRKALELQPLNRDAVFGVNYLYEKSGDIKKAIAHMKEAVPVFEEDVDVMLRCADLYLIDGDTASAKDFINRVKAKDPEDTKARRLLGDIYLKDGLKKEAWVEYLPVIDQIILEEKYDSAIKLLEPFKEIDPLETGKRLVSLYRQLGENDNVKAELTALADALVDKQMDDDALSCYREALELAPDDEELRQKIAGIEGEHREEETAAMPEQEPPAPPEFEIERFGEPEEGEKEVPEKEHVVIKGDKTADEILTEADIFSRYGLLNEAQRVLEELRQREPGNIDARMKLKSVYMEMSDKEAFVAECLALNELFRSAGDNENADRVLHEARELYPEDPRLAEREGPAEVSETGPSVEEFADMTLKAPEKEDYEEELSEADFYAKQGLPQEATKILEELYAKFPDDERIKERLDNLGQITESPELEEIPETDNISEEAFRFPEEAPPAAPEEPLTGEEEAKGVTEEAPAKEEYEDLSIGEQEIVDAQEMPEPELDNDVLEIFQEFKKGLEKELGEEDYETHYNLGIAYKEMGLIDDAIGEFQIAKNDPRRLVQVSSMLGVCYMEKGLYTLAIDTLKHAIKDAVDKDESYWAVSYDLAEAYEKNNNLSEALDLYTEVFGWNAQFRNVSAKLNELKPRVESGAETKKPKERKDRVSYL